MGNLMIGLLGSGEFEPWALEVDRALLAGVAEEARRVLVLPTASAPEGEAVFEAWAEKALGHYGALGVSADVVPLKTRADAEDEEVVAYLDGVSLAFFSGGNPSYLAKTLIGTRFWSRLPRSSAKVIWPLQDAAPARSS